MSKQKIAFIRPAAYPLPNAVLPHYLGKAFPEYTLEIIDIRSIIKSNPMMLVQNSMAMIVEYGLNIARGLTTTREAFYTTNFLNKRISRMLNEKIKPEEFAFSFQIQSLFDASTGAVPHFVYTDHTHLARLTYPNFDQRKLRGKKWIEMERGIYEHASVIFTRSQNITKSLNQQYDIPFQKLLFAGVGSNVDTNGIQPDNDDYHNKKILFVGIDWERKDGPTLLKAFQKVLEKHPDAHLFIVGASIETTIPNCESVGKISVKEMGDFYRKASIFCLPTRMEPFGVAFIEALFYKLPIVATNIGAIPDFVRHGHNGYLVEPGDVDGIAHYLDILLSDPGLSRLFGQQGYELAKTNYSWDSVAEKMSQSIRNQLSTFTAARSGN